MFLVKLSGTLHGIGGGNRNLDIEKAIKDEKKPARILGAFLSFGSRILVISFRSLQ